MAFYCDDHKKNINRPT